MTATARPDARPAAAAPRPIRLPVFHGGERPAPESLRRKALIRGWAVATIALSFSYLAWRASGTVDLAVWWVAVPLLLAEVHNFAGLALFTLALWDVDRSPAWRRVDATPHRIAVLIPTYNEPEDVLLPTVAAAVAIELPHETWVLDDGRRPEVRELAEALGARYLARPSNEHAKAGNLNHALEHIDADLIAVFDADHVAKPEFLRHTLCYFDDPRVAVVQTPQDFYNLDSFEHEWEPDERGFNEEAVFYRVIAPAKNFWGGAFWCGTNAVVRVSALREVGGVATETVTEDIHTTIRLNRRGWTAVYHNEVLARGLAPADAIEYMTQRHRWALGAMQVLRAERPTRARGLSLGQWLSFGTTLVAWFDSWRTLAFILLPIAVVLTGAAPIAAPGHVYGPLFLLTFSMQFVALRLLTRGHYPPLLSLLFEVLRMPAVLPATLAGVLPGRRGFSVTHKGRAGDERRRGQVPPLLGILAAGCVIALAWFVATMAGLTPMTYHEMPATLGAVAFLLLNFALLVMAVGRIRSARFARERRAGVRLGVGLSGSIDGQPCEILDLSATGARLLVPRGVARDIGNTARLAIDLPAGTALLHAEVRRRQPREGFRAEIGLRFAPGQRGVIARLSRVLLNGRDDAAPEPGAVAA